MPPHPSCSFRPSWAPFLILSLWRGTGWCLAPVLRLLLANKRDNKDHLEERFGHATHPRPDGRLLWIHAASIGESLSTFSLIDALLRQDPVISLLMTTTTRTGKQTVVRHPAFGQRLFHQFIPYDTPCWVRRFLSHWRPDGAVFVESELWPGIIEACRKRSIAFMLVNARLSAQSARRWQRCPALLQYLLNSMAWISPRSDDDRTRLDAFKPKALEAPADLKEDAPPLPFNKEDERHLRHHLANRPVFVAASTHEGEEEIIIEAAEYARKTRPDLLTILIPRHPVRGHELALRFHAPARSAGQKPTHSQTLWIVDTLGELGLFYRLAEKVFLGHSLCPPGGGHNPFEPLRLGKPLAVGPFMQNWHDACQSLGNRIHTVRNAHTLAAWLLAPLPPPSPLRRISHVSHDLAQRILNTLPVRQSLP